MKKIIFSIFGVLIISFSIFFTNSCLKDNDKVIETRENVSNNIALRNELNSAKIHIDCVGNCENNTSCGAIMRLPSGDVECSCTPCKMQLSETNPLDMNTTSRADMPKIAAHFLDYIKRVHGTENYLIKTFDHNFYELSEFIEITYIINDDSSKIFSLGFVVKYNSSEINSGGPIYLVDCHGDCGSSGGQCVEVYNAKTGEVYCKCQSDNCKMTVEEVKK